MDSQMSDAIRAMAEHRARARGVDRRGWTDHRWVEDARQLMGDLDGSVTSLVNGHVLSLLAEVDRLTAERDAVAAARDRQVRRAEVAEGMVRKVYAGIGKLLDPILGTEDEGRDEGLVEAVERALRLAVAAELLDFADLFGGNHGTCLRDRAAELDPEGGA